MIKLRRAEERQYHQRRRERAWSSFDPEAGRGPPREALGGLRLLEERRLSPQGGTKLAQGDLEIITYVRDGTLHYEDPTGRSGTITAGEFQRMTLGIGSRYREVNASSTDSAHIFQVWLRPTRSGLEPGHEQRRFYSTERSGKLCLVASLDGRDGSLRIHQDTRIYSAILGRGRHLAFDLAPHRGAWLHVVVGTATLEGEVLSTGDAAWIVGQPTISLTASDDTEILLLDVAVEGPAMDIWKGPPEEIGLV